MRSTVFTSIPTDDTELRLSGVTVVFTHKKLE